MLLRGKIYNLKWELLKLTHLIEQTAAEVDW